MYLKPLKDFPIKLDPNYFPYSLSIYTPNRILSVRKLVNRKIEHVESISYKD